MELPLGGPALRHYTQSRPRPHRQKLNYRPSRPQETIIESENEVLEHMGRVDEGVEEFFTKRVLPTDILDKPDEELTVVQEEVAPDSSIPCPAPTKTLKRKLGDFFTLKKRRGLKSEPSQEGRAKKTSIADLIRPLREATRSDKDKDKDRVKEQAKENEKDKGKEHPSVITGESVVQETPVTDDASLRSEVVPPRRALREGKSQSLILLSGSAATGTANAKNTAKKQFEGQHSFEQKLHLMLQRIGVSKPQPAETQNQDGEMKKAESEGTIIDSKSEPPPTLSKPRTMSASSDTRHQIRTSVSAHEAAGKPALLPKPVVKPGPPPAASGRNTPENELTQIQEAESNTPAKLSPASAKLSPASATPGLTDATAPFLPTISNPVSDSACVTVSPASTVTPADTDVCVCSDEQTAETPTSSTALKSKRSTHKTGDSSTELPTSPKSTTEPPSTISVPSTSSESTTPCLPVTSISTVTSLPYTTPETVSALIDQSSVSTTSTNLLTESTLLKSNGVLSVDSTLAAEGDTSVLTTASSPCTTISVVPLSLSAIPSSDTAVGDDTSLFASCSHASLLSSVPEVTQSLPNSSESITVAVSGEIPDTKSSTVVSPFPPSTSFSHSAPHEAISSTSSSEVNSSSTTETVISTIISPPSTSTDETKPKDTTSTTTSCSNETENTFTCSSVTAVSFSCTNGSDISNNVSTTLSPPASGLLPADNSSATSHDVIGSTDDSPGQDQNVKTSEEDGTKVEEAETMTEKGHMDEEVVQMQSLGEVYGSEETTDTEKKDESGKEKAMLDNGDMTETQEQGESVKAENDTLNKAGKESEQSRDEAVAEAQIQEEKTSESSK